MTSGTAKSGVGTWVLGTGASIALHGAGAVVALALVAPEEMPDQPTPGAQFELETTALDRSRAEEQAPDSEAASEQSSEGATTQGQTIARRSAPTSAPEATAAAAVADPSPAASAVTPSGQRADAQLPDATVATAAAPETEVTAAAAPDSDRAEVRAPEAATAPAAAPPSADVPAASPAGPVVTSGTPVGERAPSAEARAALAPTSALQSATALAAPAEGRVATPFDAVVQTAAPAPTEGQTARAAEAEGQTARAAEAEVQVAAAAPASGATAPPAPAEGTPATSAVAPSTEAAAAAIDGPVIGAELAWAGQGALDPQGLAAVQAFLPEAARGTEGEEVRDDISSLMSSVPCARVHTAFNADTGALEVRGHVPSNEARPELVGALQARVGESLPVTDALRLLPEPQCDVLSGIEGLGLPPSEEQFTDPALVGETGWAQDYDFRGGDALKLQLRGADYPAYVYLDYYDGDGNVVHVVPNEFIALPFLQPDEPFFVGPDEGFEIYFSPPYGQDIVVAIASETPLYEGLRPLVEPAETYLAFLRGQMEALGQPQGEWAYFFVTTRAP